MNKANVIRDLQRSMDLTIPFFDRDLAFLRQTYAPGKWNVGRILAHLVDCEIVFQDRTRMIVAQPGCRFEAMDPDRWARTLVYADRNLSLARRVYRACRESLIELVDLLPEAIFGRDGHHPEHASYRAWDVVTKASTHNMHHFGQLVAIRDGKEWRPRGES